ncbi:hypothetical protein CEK26_008601 [Fusarium fujikuroi]|nr:hypothetical protein CEK26_008601 [Fusarium fujikuroi]
MQLPALKPLDCSLDTFSCYYSKFAGKRAGFKSPKDFPFIYIALASFRPSPSFYNARSNY